MPSGVNVVSLPSVANTWATLYGPVPAGFTLVFNVRATSVTATAATVRIATTSAAPTAPAVADHIEFDSPVGAAGTAPLLNTGEVALAGQYVGVRSSVASGVTFRLSGFLKADA